jgi:transcriptional regulator with XRE-family HTH domain
MLEEPGRRLRSVRERLRLRYRNVEEASQRIASRHRNDEFIVGLSRLADIENKGTIPSIYRLYSLCAIYGLDFNTALSWYGIDLKRLTVDAAGLPLGQTRPVEFDAPPDDRDAPEPVPALTESPKAGRSVQGKPAAHNPELPKLGLAETGAKTTLLSGRAVGWGKLPLALLDSPNLQGVRYAFIGTDDWTMFPVIPPGAFVQVDESHRRIAKDGWSHDYDRPLYLIEHRGGFRCGWCTEIRGMLILQPHPLSPAPLQVFRYPGEADVIGQVVGVTILFGAARARRTRS